MNGWWNFPLIETICEANIDNLWYFTRSCETCAMPDLILRVELTSGTTKVILSFFVII
uniref:Bm1664, isoform a n=1 Tax=Brugia malayi TaxID=6279 RepID=A0A0J9Y6R9_BRUMA|nr:Bm1664, isoform a [Brugia malayi]